MYDYFSLCIGLDKQFFEYFLILQFFSYLLGTQKNLLNETILLKILVEK